MILLFWTFFQGEIHVFFRDENEDTQRREVGWNKYINVTEQIYRIQELYNSKECPSGTVRQLEGSLPECQVQSVYIVEV